MGSSFSSCLPRISIYDAEEEEESVKVVRVTDGELFQYPGPVFVKDLMYGFEGFGVFHFDTVKQPLPPETELKFSEVYYLRPWISQDESEKALDDSKSESYDQKPGGLRSPKSGHEKKVKKVRFLDEERLQQSQEDIIRSAHEDAKCRELRDSFPGAEVLSQEEKGVVRMKLVISKKQLSELMSRTQKPDHAFLESIIAPLTLPKADRPAPIQDEESILSQDSIEESILSPEFEDQDSLISPASSWAPSLHQIPEAR